MTDADALHEEEHAGRMRKHLRAEIAAHEGFLPFDRYMQEALYAPALGYYSAGARKLGAQGDFTTAPESSVLFGRCVAAQCEEVLHTLGQGRILELGAGSGRLAFDVLTELARRNCLPERYAILEVSPDLRQRQRELLATLPVPLAERVEFLDRPPQLPWHGVLLANEVLDALPCELFALRAGGVVERGVGVGAAGEFIWRERPAPLALASAVAHVLATLPEALPAEYESEVCLRVGPWVAAVTATLGQGVALFIDYGLPRAQYYHPERSTGTLRCHYRQRAHDNPFFLPGLQDLTAWVDFTRVAEAADACGLEVVGFTTQAAFLLGTGIEAQVASAPEGLARARLASLARTLLMPEQMGEAFKVMALGRGWDAPLAGFAHQDLLSRL